ncbi:zinc finger BED domain-containing protein 4-like [Ischnura elegans]|uniref:zinc finger BED domain-containing protein 4-like n=1 Tax=Ischnura elegans TaxID=197161 RepID=UPI001ED8AD50|nr:zinc finger BED domain-containing protein 4-like [Ischnura elegans]
MPPPACERGERSRPRLRSTPSLWALLRPPLWRLLALRAASLRGNRFRRIAAKIQVKDMPHPGRRRISVIWDYFQDEGGDYASCNICKRRVSFKTSTTNLKRHVERVHHTSVFRNKLKLITGGYHEKPSEARSCSVSSLPPPETPTSSSTVLISKPANQATNPLISRTARFAKHRRFAPSLPVSLPKPLEHDAKKIIDEALLNLFIWDLQPFNIVEERGFVEYTRALNSLYHLPNKNYLSNVKIPAMYQKCLERVSAVVEEQARSVCITLYSWTSRTDDVYLAIMAHFIGVDFDFHSFLLECATFVGPASSEKFADVLGRVLKEWDLDGKVSVVVSEDDAALKEAVIKLLAWPHMDCYARSLNSVIQRAIHKKEVRKTLEKVRAVVSFFKGDPLANDVLLRQQPRITPPKGLLEDRPQRWDSTLFMVQRFSQLQVAITGATEVIGESDVPEMSPEEWQICSQLSEVLQPFEEVVAQMSREEYTTTSQILVLTRGLRSLCNKLLSSVEYNFKVKAVISELLTGLNEKFTDVERWEEVAMSTLLDPRFKGHAFSGDEAARAGTIESVTVLVREQYERECDEDSRIDPEPDSGPSGEQTGRLSAWEDFDSIVKEVQPRGTPDSLAEKEVQRYLQDKLLTRYHNPFCWWKKNQHVYPNLAKLVPYKCNMLATALPCERIFSRIQNQVNERSSALDEKELQQLLFLNTNMARVVMN